MGRKIYRNRKILNHPSIENSSNEKVWKNMPLTPSPNNKHNYKPLNDSLYKGQKKKSYVQKNVRQDPLRTRGKQIKKFQLSKRDEKLIDNLSNKKH